MGKRKEQKKGKERKELIRQSGKRKMEKIRQKV